MASDIAAIHHALVSVNGDCDQRTLQAATLFPNSRIVAVDGGLRHIIHLNRQPDWLIGDLDSVDPEFVTTLDPHSTTVIRHPVEKDATDLELALLELSRTSTTAVTLIGIDGGRLDHVLANVLLLCQRDWPFSIEFFVSSGYGCLITSRNSFNRDLPLNTTLSLLPMAPQVTGVSTTGLHYPLDQADIELGSTLGISNVTNQRRVGVSVVSGQLLLMY